MGHNEAQLKWKGDCKNHEVKKENRALIHQITTQYQVVDKKMELFWQLLRNVKFEELTVLPRINAAPAPKVAPIESATKPTGSPKR